MMMMIEGQDVYQTNGLVFEKADDFIFAITLLMLLSLLKYLKVIVEYILQ